MDTKFKGEAWDAVKQHATKRIEELHRLSEELSLTDQQRRDNMARIAELRALLGLDASAPQVSMPPDYSS